MPAGSVTFALHSCHCEACSAGRGNLNPNERDCFALLAMTPVISGVTDYQPDSPVLQLTNPLSVLFWPLDSVF